MEIKTRPSLTPEEVTNLKKQREQLENIAKQEANKKFVGNLKKKTITKDRFHLPVLHINDATQWPSQPLENRLHWTDEIAYKTCLGNCCGIEGLKAGCCHMDPDDMEHVLGPVDQEWIQEIVTWFRKKGIMMGRADIVIDFEEGKILGEKFFNGERKAVFMSPDSYPILRFQIEGPRFACKFLSPDSGKCTIYEKRPQMCRGYLCSYIKSNFLVRTRDKPNTYQKLR